MAKSPDAFRTISEVAEWLDTQAHVLRFWESKFTQVKPVKRAGGRRYYRPADMQLLGGIKHLLHDEGMTIKGAQKLLREKGVKHVALLSPDIDDDQPDVASVDVVPETVAAVPDAPVTPDMPDQVVTAHGDGFENDLPAEAISERADDGGDDMAGGIVADDLEAPLVADEEEEAAALQAAPISDAIEIPDDESDVPEVTAAQIGDMGQNLDEDAEGDPEDGSAVDEILPPPETLPAFLQRATFDTVPQEDRLDDTDTIPPAQTSQSRDGALTDILGGLAETRTIAPEHRAAAADAMARLAALRDRLSETANS